MLSDGRGARPEADRPPLAVSSSRGLLILVGVFVAGLILVAGLSYVFSDLMDALNERSANERARLFIGEEIVRGIQSTEKDFYRLAVTSGELGQERMEAAIVERVDKLRHDLKVLEVGGTVRQLIPLNIEGMEQMENEVAYMPPRADGRYVMEVIEIAPHLDQILVKVRELRRLLAENDGAVLGERLRHARHHAIDLRVRIYLKTAPPFFARLNENASRLLFESRRELDRLEAQLDAQRNGYRATRTALIVLVIVVVTLTGLLIARQMNDSNRKLRLAWSEMRAARDAAEQANMAKSAFVSRMSHELRTPMNAILGFAQLLGMDNLTAAQRQQVIAINEAGRHLLELINQILDLARIESGRLTLEEIEFDPVRLVDDTARLMAKAAHAKGVRFICDASPVLPPLILGDPTRLRQVLINLLSNAVKFTGQGEVGVRLAAVDGDTRLHLEVWDTGIGIEPQSLGRIFEPFAQADESTSRNFGGTGLGLVISADLVSAMGGHIEVASRPGEGSRFWFELPMRRPASVPERVRPLGGFEAIVVARDATTAARLADYLAALGANPRIADDPAALERVAGALPQGSRVVVLADEDLAAALPGRPAQAAAWLRVLFRCRGDVVPAHPGEADARIEPPMTFTQLESTVVELLTRRPPVEAVSGDSEPSIRFHGAVLLVEDQAVNRTVASLMLAKLGLHVDTAENGKEALRKLEDRTYDLVLMDVEMPEMDGFAATRQLRRLERASGWRRIPVIAMTANVLSEDRERSLASGMDEHLPKPITFKSLADALGRWLPHQSGT